MDHGMTIQDFQRLVWNLANKLYVRYYMEYIPGHFVIEFQNIKGNQLNKDLIELGFERINISTWSIKRLEND